MIASSTSTTFSMLAPLAALGLLAGSALAAPAADLVTSLPGWGAPLTTTYSGYLDIDSPTGPKHLHYLLYTAQGQVTPSTPLTVWVSCLL
jgi:hypothetical protein